MTSPRTLIASVLIVVAFLEPSVGETVFRADYEYLDETEYFYKFHRTRQAFAEATAVCSAEGAKLMSPRTAKEAEIVAAKFVDHETTHWWIGVHDLYNEGTFISIDGTPPDKIHTNWGPGEPDDGGESGEDCVVIDRYGLMSDVQCKDKHRFVCSRSRTNLTQNEDCETYDMDYQFDSFKCYKFHTTALKWSEAYKTCRREGSDLVVINGDSEARYLVEELAKLHPSILRGSFDKSQIHVGFNDLIEHGTFQTVDGMTLREAGYESWSPGQPDNDGGEEHCGSMFRNGTLNDVDCSSKAMFVCEKKLYNFNRLSPR